jgi:ABC-2 type transport system permease protein
MSRSAFAAILRNELLLIRRTPIVVVMLLAMPLIVTSILKPTMAASLRAAGAAGANGAEQVVPGQALLFGFFLTAFVGLTFLREHGWATWDRLRASRASQLSVVAGKCLPWTVIGLVQLVLLFALGAVLFDLRLPGAVGLLGIALVGVCWVLFVTAFSVAMVALLPSIQLVNSVANLGALVFGSLGGALVPVDQLPGWARAVGTFVPPHWAMRGFTSMLVPGSSLSSVIGPCAVLLALAVLAGLVAVRTFRFDAVKNFWA